MSSLAELRERVSKATGPDRELDAQIIAFINKAEVRPYPPTDDYGPHSKWQFWSRDGAHFLGNERQFPVPPITSSIDAALALVERLLPHHSFQLWNHDTIGGREWRVRFSPCTTAFDRGWSKGANAPLAILSALLTALDEQS